MKLTVSQSVSFGDQSFRREICADLSDCVFDSVEAENAFIRERLQQLWEALPQEKPTTAQEAA